MSRQRDLQESMTWCDIRRPESWQTHITVVDGVGVAILWIPYLNCGGGDRWWCHLSSLRKFHRAQSYCHLYGAQG
ncbi:hypothetical protein TNCV_3122451 [Trichonephila clavipes]|nr:hypothetical protein TNCV_3122451 [Trichonephila clavipes]